MGLLSAVSGPWVGPRLKVQSATTPTSVTKAWSDLEKWKVPVENQHLLLGGEFAFWTDAWCYINGCTRPGSPRGGGADLFSPARDDEFAKSVTGMLWPYGHLAAGSFWHFVGDLEKDEAAQRANYWQNTLVSNRGGMVCPVGCDCTISSICGEPLLPPPAPSPPAPTSKNCTWKSDTGIEGNDFKKVSVASKEECCAACRNVEGCAVSDFNPMTSVCHLKRAFNPVRRNDGSLACCRIRKWISCDSLLLDVSLHESSRPPRRTQIGDDLKGD